MTENTQPEKSLDELASSTARQWTRLRLGIDFDASPLVLSQFARLLASSATNLADALAKADPTLTGIQMSGHLSNASAQAMSNLIDTTPPDEIPDYWNPEP